uniref:Cytochrome P450 n=1 Tax=Megaselia scalaris TaxID=36166 RepID=T1GY73_MEGSC
MPLIDTLLRSQIEGKPFTNQEIEDQVNTFLFAGHDTTSHTFSFFLYNVAKYRKVQERIFKEIIEVFGKCPENSELTIMKMNELKYMEAVIKESMRMFATTPFIESKLLANTVSRPS